MKRDASRAASNVSGGQILIVDDEPAVADATRMLLQFEGFDVRVAASVEEAEKCMREIPVELVITDYHLRGRQTGLDVVHALRRLTRKDLPVIFVSGDTSDRIGLENIGDASLMTKPIDPEQVLAEIRSRIRLA